MRSQIIAKMTVDAATRKKLAEFLRLRRQELGLTQKQAGKLTNPPIDKATITNIELTGRIGHSTLIRYAKALNCQIPEDLIPQSKWLPFKRARKQRIRSIKLGQF